MKRSTTTVLILTLVTIVLIFFGFTLFYILYIQNQEDCNYDFINPDDEFDPKPLFLTPLIRRGEVRRGQRLASVKNWRGIDSYSGFLSVNETVGSEAHLFFWFFPQDVDLYHKDREEKPPPVILYLQGGPGISSLFGLFLETGPFHIDGDQGFHLRNYSWTETHSMLYIDNPIGTGFSFTDNKDSYAKGQEDVGRDLYEALTQFFTLFPKYRRAEFYIAGTSYAGKYIPTIAYKIHTENKLSPPVQINLKGIAIGSGYFDSILQDEFSEYYYHLGLLDGKQKSIYQSEERRIKLLVQEEEYTLAREAIANLFQDTRERYTGFNDILIHNALQPHTPPELTSFEYFLNKRCIRSSLHTGSRTFQVISQEAYLSFHPQDFFHSTKPELETLLNENYKILMYAAQLDTIIIHTSIAKFLRSLVWDGAKTFNTIEREIWRVNGTISGYVKQSGNFVFILIRRAGHMACYEEGEWCFDMINRFTSGISFRGDVEDEGF